MFSKVFMNPICSTCRKSLTTEDIYKLDEDTLDQIDFYGVESIPELQQAIYQGMKLCIDCYYEAII